MAKQPLGFVIDRGNSPIDGQPYVVILTLKSSNRKTGDMAQVFILREDVNPVAAIATGDDVSICGSCPHRRKQVFNEKTRKFEWVRSCYVNPGQAPLSVWKTFKRGGYIELSYIGQSEIPSNGSFYPIIEKYLQGRKIRWGTYGDPAIIKPQVVNLFNSYAIGHTGYTHQWRQEFAQVYAGIFQASCDGFADYLSATAHGWKTFLVIPKDEQLPAYAKQCPATVDNSQAQCLTCSLCDGAKLNIVVHAHGTGAKYVKEFA
jgi:hypothetical protein